MPVLISQENNEISQDVRTKATLTAQKSRTSQRFDSSLFKNLGSFCIFAPDWTDN